MIHSRFPTTGSVPWASYQNARNILSLISEPASRHNH